MVSIKLFVFASLKHLLSEQSEIKMTLNKNNWNSAEELKLFLLNHLMERWIGRQTVFIGEGDRRLVGSDIQLPDSSTFMLAVNEQYVEDGTQINLPDNATIALIPPVSGG